MKLTKSAINKLTCQEAMILCNKLGLPEGSHEEMKEALLDHLESKPE